MFLAGLVACGRNDGATQPEPVPFAVPPQDLAACGTDAPLTTSPVTGTIPNIVPLGNLNPGGHTFPSDHLYFMLPSSGSSGSTRTVVAPGDIRVTGVASSRTTLANGTSVIDYSLYFYACADVQFFMHHIRTLSAQIRNASDYVPAQCSGYTTGGLTYQRCNKAVDIAISAGSALGTVGGFQSYSFDLGAYDRRAPRLAFVNQSFPDFGENEFNTFHTVCPLDYFTPSVKASLESLLGNATKRRTAPPVCGQIMYDVPGTAKGRWFNGPFAQEDTHLALVDDNVDPTLGAISMGTSVPSIPRGVYLFSHDGPAGSRINYDFSALTLDGNVYCFQSLGAFGFTSNLHVLVQVMTTTSIRIEGFAGDTCGDPTTWVFTAGAIWFLRSTL